MASSAPSTTIREYLVNLGFSVDQAKMQSFKDVIGGTANVAAKLGTEVVAVGLAITGMVEGVARHFSDLYYMSQRTGSTVASLSAVGFAAKQVGLSTEEAQGAVESFASSLRHQPGLAGLAQRIGGGKLTGDSEKDLRALFKGLSKMPDVLALQFLPMFGQNERTYLQYKNNMAELERAEEEHTARLRKAGLATDEWNEKWVKLTRTFNSAWDSIKVGSERLAADWHDSVESILKETTRLVERFTEADKESGGKVGRAATLLGGSTGASLLMRILGKGKGSMWGVLLAMMQMVKEDDPELRTGLRKALGIPDDKEERTAAPTEGKGGSTWETLTAMLRIIGNINNPKGLRKLLGVPEDAPLDPPRVLSPGMEGPLVNPPVIGGQKQNLTGPTIGPKVIPLGLPVIHQTNHITGVRDPDQVAEKIASKNRDLTRMMADAMRTGVGMGVA